MFGKQGPKMPTEKEMHEAARKMREQNRHAGMLGATGIGDRDMLDRLARQQNNGLGGGLGAGPYQEPPPPLDTCALIAAHLNKNLQSTKLGEQVYVIIASRDLTNTKNYDAKLRVGFTMFGKDIIMTVPVKMLGRQFEQNPFDDPKLPPEIQEEFEIAFAKLLLIRSSQPEKE